MSASSQSSAVRDVEVASSNLVTSTLVVAPQQLQVRIRRPKIGELAHQAQGERIFAEGEYPATYNFFSAFLDSKVFRNFADAFPRFAHLFGSVDRFEPAKCIFCIDSPQNQIRGKHRGRFSVSFSLQFFYNIKAHAGLLRIIPIATVFVILCPFTDSRFDWILVNIFQNSNEIGLGLHRLAFEAVLEQMPVSGVFGVIPIHKCPAILLKITSNVSPSGFSRICT